MLDTQDEVVLSVWVDADPEMQVALERFYDEEHFPNLLKVPGILSAKRALNTREPIKPIVVCKDEHIDLRYSMACTEVMDTEWSVRMRSHFKDTEEAVEKPSF